MLRHSETAVWPALNRFRNARLPPNRSITSRVWLSVFMGHINRQIIWFAIHIFSFYSAIHVGIYHLSNGQNPPR